MNIKCGNCGRTQSDEPFWTSRKTGKALTVCADCLYNLDGIDYRGQSLGTALRELERKRKKGSK